jgi:outer membrane protein assembly factor BamB
VSAFDLVDGTRQWHSPAGDPITRLSLQDRRAAYVNKAMELVVLDVSRGECLKKVSGATVPAPPVFSGESILYATSTGIRRYDFAEDDSTEWLSLAGLGSMTSPMIVADSTLFFATDRRGLVGAGRAPR